MAYGLIVLLPNENVNFSTSKIYSANRPTNDDKKDHALDIINEIT